MGMDNFYTAWYTRDMIRVHSIETMGALDGPGIRTVIFFQGCPMRCGYCHNADTLSSQGGTEMSVRDLVEFCLRYRNYYGANGGVTLSGGEPLAQAEAARNLLLAFKKQAIHTALDTSGAIFAPPALDAADLVILDIKHTDPEEFMKLTGYPQDSMRQTLAHLQKNNSRFWVRQVTVAGFTDSKAQVLALKKMSAGAEKIELLPYRNVGAYKWKQLDLAYPFEGVCAPTRETMAQLRKLLD